MTYDRYPTTTYYKWITSPYASAAASIMASLMVGCGCTALIISCPVDSNLRATTTSAIISVTLVPIIWAPRNSPYLASKITFTKPSFAPAALALPDAEKGNLPTLTSYPASLAAFSVKPTDAISGVQYVQPGMLL